MTRRAIAPVPIDMAAGLTSPLASTITLKEAATPAALAAGQPATITLTATNESNRTATGVLIKDEPPSPLGYVPGSTTVEGRPLPDGEEQAPPLAAGGSIPTLAPRANSTVTCQARSPTQPPAPRARPTAPSQARSTPPVPATQALALHGTASSAKEPAPAAANAPRPLS